MTKSLTQEIQERITELDKCENIVRELNLKKCCKECGFPLDIERKPVFLSDNIFSLISYEENKCKTCGHQKSGWTINSVYNHIQKLRKNWENKQQEKINKLKEIMHYLPDDNSVKVSHQLIDKILGGET